MAQDVTAEALKGFTWDGTQVRTGPSRGIATGNPYLQTSTSWEAWQVGRWLALTGRPRPTEKSVWTSRGSTYRFKVSDIVVRVHPNGEVSIVP
jgi:hypothetical protein